MSHKITIISFYILRIFMTVFTISEYFIGHHFQAVSYILKRRGNSLEESACVGCSRSECEELRIPQIWGRGQECVEWVSCQEVTTDCHWDPLWFSVIILSEQAVSKDCWMFVFLRPHCPLSPPLQFTIQCFDPNKFRCKIFAWKHKR